MTHTFERESDAGNDTLPVFYLIRFKDRPEEFYGRDLRTRDSRIRALCLFTGEADAQECVHNRLPDPESVEVVRSDELGGILALLERDDPYFSYVVFNPPPTAGLRVETWEMGDFIAALLSAPA